MKSTKISFILITAFLALNSVYGQVSLTKTYFEGREAYALQNDKILISMLSGVRYIAELRQNQMPISYLLQQVICREMRQEDMPKTP